MMRKYVLTFFFAFVYLAACALPTSAILLQHDGNVTVYQCDSLTQALENSVDGDTIFLPKGTFPGFTIDKKITVRGAGSDDTVITGDIIVAISDSINPLAQTVLEGVWVKNFRTGVHVTKSLRNFAIRQSEFGVLGFDRPAYDVVVDRCRINDYLFVDKNVMSICVNNTKIKQVSFHEWETEGYWHQSYPCKKDVTFVNSTIKGFGEFECFRGTAINSAIGYGRTGSYVTMSGCSLINTLVCSYRLTIDNSCYQENVWLDESYKNVVNDNLNTYSEEVLREKGYIGNDGTVIGFTGGTTPYSLQLAVPKVTKSEMSIDKEQKVLHVKLKIGNQ